MSYVVFTLQYNDFTFGPMPHATLVLICTNLGCMYFKMAYVLKKQMSTKVHFIMLYFLIFSSIMGSMTIKFMY